MDEFIRILAQSPGAGIVMLVSSAATVFFATHIWIIVTSMKRDRSLLVTKVDLKLAILELKTDLIKELHLDAAVFTLKLEDHTARLLNLESSFKSARRDIDSAQRKLEER